MAMMTEKTNNMNVGDSFHCRYAKSTLECSLYAYSVRFRSVSDNENQLIKLIGILCFRLTPRLCSENRSETCRPMRCSDPKVLEIPKTSIEHELIEQTAEKVF